jgi:hypothetical protein
MFTFRSEACVTDSATDANMLSVRSWGRWRLCYDPSGSGDCSGASPAGTVILGGSSTIASEQGHNAGGATMVVGEVRRTQSAPFTFPPITGSGRNISMKIGLVHFSAEPFLSPCTGPDCGISGCMVKLK